MTWQPRNEFVLCRLEKLAVDPSALAYPDQSIQSKRLVVVALGPKVEGLVVGDEVLALGAGGASYFELPHDKNYIAIEQKFVALRRLPA